MRRVQLNTNFGTVLAVSIGTVGRVPGRPVPLLYRRVAMGILQGFCRNLVMKKGPRVISVMKV